MKWIKAVKPLKTILAAGLMIIGLEVSGQQGSAPEKNTEQGTGTSQISDERLKKFVDVYKKLAPTRQQAEAKMIDAIEKQGITAERFTEIASAQQSNTQANSGTPEEMKKFNAAAKDVSDIQKEFQPKIEKIMTDEGMKPEEFENIVIAYQTDSQVQQKIQALLKTQ